MMPEDLVTSVAETDAYVDRITELEQQRDDLLALVEEVEWMTAVGGEDAYKSNMDYCAWCQNWKREGHKDDCPRQAAIARVRGAQ